LIDSAFGVRPLGGPDLAGPLLEPALSVFGSALGYRRSHGRVTGLEHTLRRHATRDGFRAFGAFDSAGRLVGFTYGYTSQPGLWWREQIAPALDHHQCEHWLADAFELAELHVHPAAQGNHLGSTLHDSLIRDLPHATALLSVMHRSQRARSLYTSRGWQTLIEDLRFSTEPTTPFSVLGLELRSPRL
jgi:ribosomal protein S18 acetylase RimI-like enzyme